MQHRLALVATLLSLAAVFTPAAGQSAADLVGKWDIEWSRGQRRENDAVTNIMAKGKLTIVQSGDSLLATLEQPPRPDGTPAPTATFGGRVANGSAVFVQKQTAQLNMNGEMQTVESISTWTLKGTGDALSGSIVRELPGRSPPGAPAPVTGTRVK